MFAAGVLDRADLPTDGGATETRPAAESEAVGAAEGHAHRGTERRVTGWFGLYRDAEQGIRIDRELERAPGVPFARVLIAFRDKALADERATLKAEGFRFDNRVEAWGKEATAANVLLAKHLVNRFLEGRGVGSQLYV